MKWPYHQKNVNQITLNHTTLWNIALPIFEVFFQILLECESFLESNSWHFCFIWEKLGWLNWSCNFSAGLSSFNPKELCCSYPWSSSLCEGRASICTVLISRKICRFLLMFLTGFSSVSYFFFLYRSSSLSLCTVFDAIWSKIDEDPQSSHLLMCLSLKTLTSILRTG